MPTSFLSPLRSSFILLPYPTADAVGLEIGRFSMGELASGHRAEPSPLRLAPTAPFPSVVPAKAGTQNAFEGLVWPAGTKAGFPLSRE